eukprot:3932506-Rhodomonas_salina.1
MNACAQAAIFLPFVQAPVALTGHMLYVDIGWPCGLVTIGMVAVYYGTGYWLRRWLFGCCFLLHGGRMAAGAIYLFGRSSGFSYRFKQDLPRYQYARYRWSSAKECAMPAGTWWVKMQHDTATQGFLNTVLLSLPAFLAASNPDKHFHIIELIGLGTWVGAWVVENLADAQKIAFVAQCHKLAKEHPERREQMQTATLGMAPDDKKAYLWAKCRHPNYFGEWLCWVGVALAAFPSLRVIAPEHVWVRLGCGAALLAIPRLLYDCLVHWTGAGPAEHYRSVSYVRILDSSANTGMVVFLPMQGLTWGCDTETQRHTSTLSPRPQ